MADRDELNIDLEKVGDHLDFREDAIPDHLRNRLFLAVISVAESEAKKHGMVVSQPVMACLADLALKFAEELAKDLELFMQHGGRKSVNMEDVIISAHRNEDLISTLRSFSNELKEKDGQTEKKRNKHVKIEERIDLE